MGWCSGTIIFDDVCSALLDSKGKIDKKAIIKRVVKSLEESDWDCHQDSEYWDDPLVQEVMREIHPEWFDGD